MWHPSPLLAFADIILTSHHHVPAKSVLLQVKHDMFPQINQKCCRHLLTTNRHVYVNVSKRTQYFHVVTYLRDLMKGSLQFKTRELMLSTWWHFHPYGWPLSLLVAESWPPAPRSSLQRPEGGIRIILGWCRRGSIQGTTDSSGWPPLGPVSWCWPSTETGIFYFERLGRFGRRHFRRTSYNANNSQENGYIFIWSWDMTFIQICLNRFTIFTQNHVDVQCHSVRMILVRGLNIRYF